MTKLVHLQESFTNRHNPRKISSAQTEVPEDFLPHLVTTGTVINKALHCLALGRQSTGGPHTAHFRDYGQDLGDIESAVAAAKQVEEPLLS